MADTSDKIDQIISELVENGKYFTINRAAVWQDNYQKLAEQYIVLSISFEASDDLFVSWMAFARRKWKAVVPPVSEADHQ